MQKFIVVCWQYSKVRLHHIEECLWSDAIIFIADANRLAMMTVLASSCCGNGSQHGLCVLGLSERYSCRLCAFWIYSECRLLQYTIPRPVTWPAICRKRPNSLWNGVILQHDNAPPHKACQTVEKVAMMGRELPPHPPCSQT